MITAVILLYFDGMQHLQTLRAQLKGELKDMQSQTIMFLDGGRHWTLLSLTKSIMESIALQA